MNSRLTLSTLLLLTAPLTAAPPTLTALTPRGAERGKALDITLTGTNLGPDTRLVLPFQATQSPLPDAKPNPAQVRLRLTVEAATPVGIYPVRVRTADGVSGLQWFSVEAFPSVREVEDNNTPEKAQKVSIPVVIDGQCPGGDVDYFRFSARKGQRLILEVLAARLGAALLPQLRVTDERGRLLAADDSQSLQGDGRIILSVPADGDYLVELSDSRYRGGNPAHYRLQIAEYDVAEEVFPRGGRRGSRVEFRLRGGTLSRDVTVTRTLTDELLPLDGALRVGMPSPRLALGDYPEVIWDRNQAKEPRARDLLPPVTVNGRLDRPGVREHFQIAVEPGSRYRFTVQAESLGSRLDGVLKVSDPSGKQLALVDDVDLSPTIPGQQPLRTADPSLELTVPDGVRLLNVELRDQRLRGGVNFGYRLTVERSTADFLVHQPVTEVNVPRGGSVLLTVPVTRRGYNGPVRLTALNLPAGVTAQGGYVPAGATRGVLTLSATPDAAWTEVPQVTLEGRSLGGTVELRARGEQRLLVSREANPGASQRILSAFALGLSGADPFSLQAPAAAVEVVLGYPTTVSATITRGKDQAALAVAVTGLDPRAVPVPGQAPQPALFQFQPSAASAAPTATFTLTPALTAPEGLQDVLLQGRAKVGASERVVNGSALTLNVRRPFTVELANAPLTLTPGQTVALRGKVLRQSVFQEAVQLRLTGLPAGVTLAAPLAPLPGKSSEFVLELKVDARTTPTAMLNLTLACTATINGLAYVHPPLTVPAQVKK